MLLRFLSVLIVVTLMHTNSYGLFCSEAFSQKRASQFVFYGAFSQQPIGEIRPDGFIGRPINTYTSYTQLKVNLAKISEGEEVRLGRQSRYVDVEAFVVAKKVNSQTYLYVKRIFPTIADARNEYQLMRERELLSRSHHFPQLKFPKALGYEGNELLFEYIEGKSLTNLFAGDKPTTKEQIVYEDYAEMVEGLKERLDNKWDQLDGSRHFQVFDYEEPRIAPKYTSGNGLSDILEPKTNGITPEGGFSLLNINKEGAKYQFDESEGLRIFGLYPQNITLSPDGHFYFTPLNPELGSSIGRED